MPKPKLVYLLFVVARYALLRYATDVKRDRIPRTQCQLLQKLKKKLLTLILKCSIIKRNINSILNWNRNHVAIVLLYVYNSERFYQQNLQKEKSLMLLCLQ